MRHLESILATVPLFERLRPDEVGRLAGRFKLETLNDTGARSFDPTPDGARMLLVVKGRIQLTVVTPMGTLCSNLEPGDRYGELDLLSGHHRAVTLQARGTAEIATLTAAALDEVLNEFPVVALPLAKEMSSVLAAHNDLVRHLLDVHLAPLPPDQLAATLHSRRASLSRRGARVQRRTAGAVFQSFVVERNAATAFFILLGFLAAVAGARLTVAFILKFGLEKRLFALVASGGPNPIHVHHFNYGLIVVGLAGLLALLPIGRKALNLLTFGYGIGVGLVLDEFALFWNLDPNYAQTSSVMACALVAGFLVQIAFFGRFWSALARTIGRRLWEAR